MKNCSIVKKLICSISSVPLLSSTILGINQNISHADEAFLDSKFFHYIIDYVCNYAMEYAKKSSAFCVCMNQAIAIENSGQKPSFNIFYDKSKENAEKVKIVSLYKERKLFIIEQFKELCENKDFFKKKNLEDLLYLYAISDIAATYGVQERSFGELLVELAQNREEIQKAKEIKTKIRSFFARDNASLDLKLLDFFKRKNWKDLYLDSDGKCSIKKISAFKEYVSYINEKVRSRSPYSLNIEDRDKYNIFFLSDLLDTFSEALYLGGPKVKEKDPRFNVEKTLDFPDHQKKDLLSRLLSFSAALVNGGFLKEEYISKALEEIIKALPNDEKENLIKIILYDFKEREATASANAVYIAKALQYLLKDFSPKKQVEVLFSSFNNVNFSPKETSLSVLHEGLFAISQNIIKYLDEKQSKELFRKICSLFRSYDSKEGTYISFLLENLLGNLNDKGKVGLFLSILKSPEKCLMGAEHAMKDNLININGEDDAASDVLDGLVNFSKECKVEVFTNLQRVNLLKKFFSNADTVKSCKSLSRGIIFELFQNLISTLSKDEKNNLFFDILKNTNDMLKKEKTAENFYVDLLSICFKNVEFLQEKDSKKSLLDTHKNIFDVSKEAIKYLSKEQSKELFIKVFSSIKNGNSKKLEYIALILECLLSKLDDNEKTDLFFYILKHPKKLLSLESLTNQDGTKESDPPKILANFFTKVSKSLKPFKIVHFAKEQRVELFKKILSETSIIKTYESLQKETIFDFFKELLSTLSEEEKSNLFFDILKNAEKIFKKLKKFYVDSDCILKALFCLIEDSSNDKLKSISRPDFVQYFTKELLVEEMMDNLQEKSKEKFNNRQQDIKREDFKIFLEEANVEKFFNKSTPVILRRILVEKAEILEKWVKTSVQPSGSDRKSSKNYGVSELKTNSNSYV